VIAPTLVPVRPGDRVKTNRRDAMKLARSYRSGDLTAVWVPDAEHEALHDLVRDGGAHPGHEDEVLLGVLDALADGLRHLAAGAKEKEGPHFRGSVRRTVRVRPSGVKRAAIISR